jgi:hypothetical protein
MGFCFGRSKSPEMKSPQKPGVTASIGVFSSALVRVFHKGRQRWHPATLSALQWLLEACECATNGRASIALTGRVRARLERRLEWCTAHKRTTLQVMHFSTDEKKDLEFQGLFLRWCPEGDSNSLKNIIRPSNAASLKAFSGFG